MLSRDSGGLVYSTGQGRMCPQCSQPIANCKCRSASATPIGNGNVRVGRATAGRKGNGVTTVTGLPLEMNALQELARKLKAKCGSGGTVKDGVIEIQGEHRDALVAELLKLGFAAKKAGG